MEQASASPYLVEGLRLFDAGRYFDAHEILEEYWIDAPKREKNFYQALIHLSVAYHHAHKGNFEGARLQIGKARTRLASSVFTDAPLDKQALQAFLVRAEAEIHNNSIAPPPVFSSQLVQRPEGSSSA